MSQGLASQLPTSEFTPLTVIDMNDKANLAFYTQLIRFEGNAGATETAFKSPSNPQQRMIQSWAHELGFEFEYTLATRVARVIKTSQPEISTTCETRDFNFLDFDSVAGTDFDNPWPAMHNVLSETLTGIDANQSYNAPSTSQLYATHANVLFHTGLSFSDFQGPTYAANDSRSQTYEHDVPYLHEEHLGLRHSRSPDRERRTIRPTLPPLRVSEVEYGHHKSSLSSPTSTIFDDISAPKFGNDCSERSQALPTLLHGRQDSTSSTGSIGSGQSHRGRKRLKDIFSSRERLHSPASGRFHDLVFESDSPRIGSPASASSGRRGPLDAAASAAARAVRAVRACWRCKFLRKTCAVENPCLACPKTSKKSNGLSWTSVGCRRGLFNEEMPPLYLCPRSHPDTSLRPSIEMNTEADNEVEQANEWSRLRIESREKDIKGTCRESINTGNSSFEVYIQKLDNPRITDWLLNSSLPQTPLSFIATITPLNECVVSIIQETLDFSCSRQIVSNGVESQWDDTVILLCSAAQHQATINSDQLIAQSLICLRSSLEALAVLDSGFLGATSHRTCIRSVCRFDCITNLNLHLRLYLDELSRVFFNKENMRAKEAWWLSTFYSFCIQAIVRRVLVRLNTKTSPSGELAARQYLYLTIRLFAASSGSYDPLMRDYASPHLTKGEKPSTVSGFCAAQAAVQQTLWKWKAISSTAAYLKKLFEDDGEELETGNVLPKPETSDEEAVPLPTTPMHEIRSQFIPRREYSNPNRYSNGQTTPTFGTRPYRASSLSSVESVNDFSNSRRISLDPPNPFARPSGARSILTPKSPQPNLCLTDTGPNLPSNNLRRLSRSYGEDCVNADNQGLSNIHARIKKVSTIADERRARNASHSDCFRALRQETERANIREEKEREAQTHVEGLEQQIQELKTTLVACEAERNSYKVERYRCRYMILSAWIPPWEKETTMAPQLRRIARG